MRLAWVAVAGFRSYRELHWEPDPAVNLIVGPNGAGKTNILEAIAYLAALRSFRGSPDEAMVSHESESAVIRGEVTDETSTLIETEVPRKGRRKVLVNRSRLQRTADLLGILRVVTFIPEDLEIVKGGPGFRRDFIDATAVQLWPGSHQDQAEYERALRQRNAFLRRGESDDVTLTIWDQRLATSAGKVMVRRARAIRAVLESMEKTYFSVAGNEGTLGFSYESPWGGSLDPQVSAAEFTDRLVEALGSRRRADLERGMTTIGPHRDEPVVLLDGYDLRYHASQGEQRTAALALRLAAHHAITSSLGRSPLLILDDVFSELDSDRGSALARALPDETQTLISTTDRGTVPVEGTVWNVKEGTIR